jgi:CBS domain-containing protein
MPSDEPVQRVRIYLNERDLTEGQPAYLAALDRLRREGATGATALRGIAGFGAGHRMRIAGADSLTTSPIVIEWVDRAERVARVLPLLDELLADALITVEDLRVYRAILRAGGPFGDRTVGQVMAREVATAGLDTPLRDAAELMLAREQPLLPVLDASGRVAGVLSDGDLLRRAGLPLPLRLFPVLTDDERRILFERLGSRALAETITADARTVYVESSIPQAISPLIEWGFEMLPVVDRDGRFAGLFGVEQALRAAASRRAEAEPAPDAGATTVRDAEPPTPVGLVMQGAVPTIAATVLLRDAMAQLLIAPERFLVVVAEGRPLGVLSDRSLAQTLREPLRSTWLGALRAPDSLPAVPIELAAEPNVGEVADRDAPTIGARATQDDAIAAMLEGGHERLSVVDDSGRLVGLVARRGLLRALAQASG